MATTEVESTVAEESSVEKTPVVEESKTEEKSVKSKATKSKAPPRLSIKQANAVAMKSGDAAEGEPLYLVPISRIRVNNNPRHEPARLYEYGYSLIGEPVELESEDENEAVIHYCLRDMALSDDLALVREFVELIESFESQVKRLVGPNGTVDFSGTDYECKERLSNKADKKGWKIEDHPVGDQSITDLAKNLLEYDDGGSLNLVPVLANPIGKSGDWNLIDGGRRVTAILYNHAKSRVQIADKVADAPKSPYSAVVKAEDRPIKADEQTNVAILLNQSRKEMSEWQLGKIYYDFCQNERLVQKSTGKIDFIGSPEECKTRLDRKKDKKEWEAKSWTMKDAAAYLNVPYGTFRNRHALAVPYEKDEKDESGKVIKKGKGLSPSDRKKLLAGEITVTHASKKALRERTSNGDGAPVATRRKPIPLSEMERLFDETPESNNQRRHTLAECMGLDFDQACKESESRIEESDKRDMDAA